MSQHRKHTDNHKRYKPKVISKSIFDDSPTLIVNQYLVPNAYADAVRQVITAYKDGTSFNKAVDRISALDPHHLNRNKLAEHTLKTIANDY